MENILLLLLLGIIRDMVETTILESFSVDRTSKFLLISVNTDLSKLNKANEQLENNTNLKHSLMSFVVLYPTSPTHVGSTQPQTHSQPCLSYTY